MIQLYLCDDEETVLHQIKTALEWKIFMENYDMEVACAAATAQELLDAVRDGSRSVYFLDVDLKDGAWDGFTLGREVRRRDPHGTLVYITSFGDLASRTFQYHLEAFDYIIKDKDQLEASIGRCLEEIYRRLLAEQQDPAQVFTVRTGDTLRHIPLDDILFFETAPKSHHVILHTPTSRLDFLGSLNELENQLGDRFIRTHWAYLVATDKIGAVDLKHNKLWVGGRECLLSRRGKSELRRKTGEGG